MKRTLKLLYQKQGTHNVFAGNAIITEMHSIGEFFSSCTFKHDTFKVSNLAGRSYCPKIAGVIIIAYILIRIPVLVYI